MVQSEDEGGRVYRPRTGMASLKSNKELRFRMEDNVHWKSLVICMTTS